MTRSDKLYQDVFQKNTGSSNVANAGRQYPDALANVLRHNATAPRINTDLVIYDNLERLHPGKHITIVPTAQCDILGFQASGKVRVVPSESNGTTDGPLAWKLYSPPLSRLGGGDGTVVDRVLFGRYQVFWEGRPEPFEMYVIEGRDGSESYPLVVNSYIITETPDSAHDLVIAAGKYSDELHGEIWVYDQGRWQKDAHLWHSIQDATWDKVILDPDMKKGIRDDINKFYDSQDTYKRLGVPWKRGLILHGPPGNGKTISLKAAMNELYKRKFEVPTLYVKTLTSYLGPEASLNFIFAKARATAPCFLIFEDLDSIVSDSVRSFFLNQVDGLSANDGILMVGSTNHLELLDPGISKRPSRFDRKYYFPNPNFEQRVAYAEFWRKKLSKNENGSIVVDELPVVKFPKELCEPIAKITDKFSFAYIQEAFVATLLQIARGAEDDDSHYAMDTRSEHGTSESYDWLENDSKSDLDKLLLWKEFKKQVKILRSQIGNGEDEKSSKFNA